MSALDSKITILLVHGAWHGSWCWKKQIPELQAVGLDTEVVDLPCTSGVAGTNQFDDTAKVRSALELLLAAGKRVVVLAHSYAGPIGSAGIVGLSGAERAAAGLPGSVEGLIVLCGYILPGGLDQGAVIDSMGGLPYVNWDSPSEGLFMPKDPKSMFFPPDVSEEDTEAAIAQIQPQSTASNRGTVPPQAWQQDPLHFGGRFGYIRCTGDAIVPIADQDGMIQGAGGEEKWITRTLDGSSHSPFLSRPKELAGVIKELVDSFFKK